MAGSFRPGRPLEAVARLYDRDREAHSRKTDEEAEEERERVLEESSVEADLDFSRWTAGRLARHLEEKHESPWVVAVEVVEREYRSRNMPSSERIVSSITAGLSSGGRSFGELPYPSADGLLFPFDAKI